MTRLSSEEKNGRRSAPADPTNACWTPCPIDRLSQKIGKYLKRKILTLLRFSFPFVSKMRAYKISKTCGAKLKFRSQNFTTNLIQTKTAKGSLAEVSPKLLLKLLPNCRTLVSSLRAPKAKLLLNCSSHTHTCSEIHGQHTENTIAVSAGHRSSLEAVSLAVLLSRFRFGGKFWI